MRHCGKFSESRIDLIEGNLSQIKFDMIITSREITGVFNSNLNFNTGGGLTYSLDCSGKDIHFLIVAQFFTLIFSQSALVLWLKMQYYRELVPLIEQGSPQPLDKTLALLGPH